MPAHHHTTTVVLAGGGTLGPVTPLLAVADAIRAVRPDAGFAWIGTRGGPEERIVAAAGIPFRPISSGKLRRYASLANVTDAFRVVRGFFEARRLLAELRADVVASAGGFVAVPVVWAAASLRIPVHVHQQDIRPGLANRLSAPFSTSFSVAFERSLRDFARRRPVWTGNPVRRAVLAGSREEALRLFGLDPSVPTVLVLGGGTGSASVNGLVRGASREIAAAANLLHVAGPAKAVAMPDAPPRYRQHELLTDALPHAYAAADVVVTRAGMGVLTELATLGKPAIIVPIAGSHQEENAAYFAARGAGVAFDERTATPGSFAAAVLQLLGDAARRTAMSEAIRSLTRPDAAAQVADLVLKAADKRKGKTAQA